MVPLACLKRALLNGWMPSDSRTAPGIHDTGAEVSWIPGAVLESLGIQPFKRARFRQASGTIVERWIGAALIHVAGQRTADDVVFGEPADLVIMGSRTLEGLNFRIDPVTKQLVDAGPAPAAVAA